jgi:signal transduction histidine kinase
MYKEEKMNAIAILSLSKTLRYIEWIVLLACAIVIFCNGIWFDNKSEPQSLFSALLVLFVLLVFALLSSIFPIDRPLWQRRAYILLELFLILLTRLFNWNLEIVLYLIYAKACFLLRRKDVIVIVFFTGITWLFVRGWLLTIPEQIEYINAQRTSFIAPNLLILKLVINDFGSYLGGSTFVILLSLVLISERRSRQKAIELAQEIDTLSAALERSRIARDIHDSLGHTLTTLNIQLELAQRLYDRNGDKARHAIDNAKKLADRSLQDVRRSVQTMRSQDFNLDEAMTNLVTQIEQNPNLEIELEVIYQHYHCKLIISFTLSLKKD